MRINIDNIKQLPERDQGKCEALLSDIDEMNMMAPSIGFYLTYNDDANDDYYGTYRLKCEKLGEAESFGMEMDIKELDNACCIAYEMVEYFLNERGMSNVGGSENITVTIKLKELYDKMHNAIKKAIKYILKWVKSGDTINGGK